MLLVLPFCVSCRCLVPCAHARVHTPACARRLLLNLHRPSLSLPPDVAQETQPSSSSSTAAGSTAPCLPAGVATAAALAGFDLGRGRALLDFAREVPSVRCEFVIQLAALRTVVRLATAATGLSTDGVRSSSGDGGLPSHVSQALAASVAGRRVASGGGGAGNEDGVAVRVGSDGRGERVASGRDGEGGGDDDDDGDDGEYGAYDGFDGALESEASYDSSDEEVDEDMVDLAALLAAN